jgi:protein tyrosine/serine phosphatase
MAVIMFGIFICRANIFDDLSAFNKANRRTVRDQMQNFHEVDPGSFYRSQQLLPEVLKSYIKRFGIKTLINLRGIGSDETTWYEKEAAMAKEWGVLFHSIPMSAVVLSEKQHLIELLSIYDTTARPILVHCLGGADRTGEASALWVLEVQKKSKEEAFKQLSIAYGHRKLINSAKDFLIQIWRGREWLAKEYTPDDYPWFCRKVDDKTA